MTLELDTRKFCRFRGTLDSTKDTFFEFEGTISYSNNVYFYLVHLYTTKSLRNYSVFMVSMYVEQYYKMI